MDPLEILRARLAELVAANQTTVNAATEAGRELTEDEEKEIDGRLDEIERAKASVTRLEKIAASTAPGQRKQPGGEPRASVPALPKGNDARTFGFKNLGEFSMAVHAAGKNDQGAMARLQASTANNEGAGSEGGFLVPPEFRDQIMQKVQGEDSLLARTDQLTPSRNSMTLPKDETTPWGSAGVQVYWEAEANQATASKAALETSTIRLNKLMGLVKVTDELLEDTTLLGSYLNSRAPVKMTDAINGAIIAGSGVGKPLGILNADCRVTVAKETSQPADTIFHRNISKMWGRLYAPCRKNAVWLVNQDAETVFDQMSFRDVGAYPSTATGTPVPVYMPPGGLSTSPYGTLKGRPVIPIEACSALGDEGDIILADLTQYVTAMKAGGMRTDVSIHLFFDYDITAYRFVFRVAGQPWWNSAITPKNSANTRSCFVTLAAR